MIILIGNLIYHIADYGKAFYGRRQAEGRNDAANSGTGIATPEPGSGCALSFEEFRRREAVKR